MLFGAQGGCHQCTCIPCNVCERTCTNPHSGDAFETVYTRYFEGAEAGNTTDGYLTATGDSDTSDPYDGMDGSGPWYQRVSGGFTLGGSSQGTRFPCSVRVSFWRNNYTLGPTVFPPPAATLTENTVEVIVTSGALIAPDGSVITPEDGAVAVSSVPLVSVSGDASSSDPRSLDGTVSYSAQCDNVETVFTIRATIRWNTKQRQHILYGKVRECYEEGTPCATICGGTSPPTAVYLTVDNISLSGSRTAASAEATYVLERVPAFCSLYQGSFVNECGSNPLAGWSLYLSTSMFGEASPRTLLMNRYNIVNGTGGATCIPLFFFIPESSIPSLCAPVSASGTNGVVYGSSPYRDASAAVIGSFDWALFT